MTTPAHLLHWLARTGDRCVCNRVIAAEPYYGMEISEEQDDPIVFFDPTHDQCLAEWGLALYPDDPLGIRHCGDAVSERLERYTQSA